MKYNMLFFYVLPGSKILLILKVNAATHPVMREYLPRNASLGSFVIAGTSVCSGTDLADAAC